MDLFPMMLFKSGGKEEMHGGMYTTMTVQDAVELDTALADGWAETTPDALAIAADANIKAMNAEAKQPEQVDEDSSPTRAELEQKAAELGLKVDARWGDKRLGEEIAAKLAG